MSRKIRIEAEGAALTGRLYEADQPRAILVIHGATGAPQGFYRPFAEWAAARGRSVLTYDYRGFGASAVGHARDSAARMTDWGLKDQQAALRAARGLAPDLPLHVVGHSLGGYMTPFHQEAHEIEAMTAVASGAPYWPHHPRDYLPAVIAFWFLIGPPVVAALGYLPGRTLGMGATLPAGVYWDWRRWCVSRDFYEGDYGGALPQPLRPGPAMRLRTLGFEDDRMMPPRAARRLAGYYPDADVDERIIAPRDYGLTRLGHLGAFRRENAALWPVILPE